MANVEKVPASLVSAAAPFSRQSGAESDDANAGKRLLAYGAKVLERYAEVQCFFHGKKVDPTTVKSFKSFVDEHMAALAARYVTTGRFDSPVDSAAEAVPTPTLNGLGISPAMQLAIASGFNPDAEDT